MAGRNLFKQLREGTKTASLMQPCIFISHTSIDKPFARRIAEFVMALGLDVYFDEYDEALQRSKD